VVKYSGFGKINIFLFSSVYVLI